MVGQCLVLVVRGEPALLQQPPPPPPSPPPPSPSPPPVAAAAATERPLWLQLQRSQRGPKGLGEERRVGRGELGLPAALQGRNREKTGRGEEEVARSASGNEERRERDSRLEATL